MQNTTNLNLKKPDQTDYVNIEDLNDNMDVLDEVIQKKYEKPTSGIPKGDFTESVQSTLSAVGELNDDIQLHTMDVSHIHWIGNATGSNSLVSNYEKITAYLEGLGVSFKVTTASTGATTLNINGLGDISILKANGEAVTNLKANGVYTLRYSGGNFTLQGEGGEFGTATSNDVLSGKTIGTEGGLISGAIPLKTAQTYTPGIADQTIASGQYLNSVQTIKGDPDLKAENIKEGIDIFGVIGTLNVASLGGAKVASGTVNATKTILQLPFKPTLILATADIDTSVGFSSYVPKRTYSIYSEDMFQSDTQTATQYFATKSINSTMQTNAGYIYPTFDKNTNLYTISLEVTGGVSPIKWVAFGY